MDGPTATDDVPTLPTVWSGDFPFLRETVTLTRLEYIELKAQRNDFKSLHQRALGREDELNRLLEAARAKIRDLNQRLYGKNSEQSAPGERPGNTVPAPGQQPGSRGHGRTARPELPVREEILDLPEHEKRYADCGLPYRDLGTTEDSEIIEIEVRPQVRKVRRKKYRRCGCGGKTAIVTAPRASPRQSRGVRVGRGIARQISVFAVDASPVGPFRALGLAAVPRDDDRRSEAVRAAVRAVACGRSN